MKGTIVIVIINNIIFFIYCFVERKLSKQKTFAETVVTAEGRH